MLITFLKDEGNTFFLKKINYINLIKMIEYIVII